MSLVHDIGIKQKKHYCKFCNNIQLERHFSEGQSGTGELLYHFCPKCKIAYHIED